MELCDVICPEKCSFLLHPLQSASKNHIHLASMNEYRLLSMKCLLWSYTSSSILRFSSLFDGPTKYSTELTADLFLDGRFESIKDLLLQPGVDVEVA